MGNWIIRWNFNKPTYAPGEQPSISFWIENVDDTQLYFSGLELDFDFGTYNLNSVNGPAMPRENRFLGSASLTMPLNLVGMRIFSFKYHMHEYINNNWVDLGSYQSDKQYSLGIYPTPFYKVFVSRGLTVEDRAIGDPIAETIREWGFATLTVGIEVAVPDEQITTQIKEEITRSDGVIAIATPRFMDALTGLWRTFEWAHDEIGISFGINKPLLILKDNRVILGGLPSYLVTYKQALSVEFNPYELGSLRNQLPAIMPAFREWIATGRKQDFLESLGKIVIGGMAVVGIATIISGIMGTLTATSKKTR